MKIEIKHCNNIDYGVIEVEENKLNIKYAPNGTGKSTIAKAILGATSEDESELAKLLPFKYHNNNPDNISPQVKGLDSITSVMCFDEEYVRKFVFKEDELIDNSFDILIKTERYQELENEIDELVAEVKSQFTDDTDMEQLIENLNELRKAFRFTKNGGIHRSSAAGKALSNKNKTVYIPEGFEEYSPFIQSNRNVRWIGWQKTGQDFLELSESCPFCVAGIEKKKEKILQITEQYDENQVKNLQAIIDVIDRLGDYFSPDTLEKLASVTRLSEALKPEEEAFLGNVKNQIDNFVDNLEKLRELSAFYFEENEDVADKLRTYMLDLKYFECLESDKTKEAITPINQAIGVLENKAGNLQGKINQQQQEIKRLIEKHQTNINEFLDYAGYRYEVKISGEGEQATLKLAHIDHSEFLKRGDQHLSFGEKNAFAIVLFMYECLAKKPDLIILDDPISSFDNNKKYAMIEMLFGGQRNDCLKMQTVLMLTHDIDPVVDMIKSLHCRFSNLVNASFLRLSGSIITEKKIKRNDFQAYSDICKAAMHSELDEIIKVIYLRRYFEILDRQGHAYQVLSNLLKKRVNLEDQRQSPVDGKFPEMANEDLISGINQIKELLTNFSYENISEKLNNVPLLRNLFQNCQNGYEKLQIFRLLSLEVTNPVIQKFINETYHIENEYICQLDPAKFDTIPEYVIQKCEELMPEHVLVD